LERIVTGIMTPWEVAGEISRRMTRIFLKDENGRRPVHGSHTLYQDDPNWRDLVLFYQCGSDIVHVAGRARQR
jgi:hypothetical protein